MALFRIFKGNKNKLGAVPGADEQDTRYAHEGFAYFTPDDGKFYIDIAGNSGDTNTPAVIGTNRIPLSADKADKDKLGQVIDETYAVNIDFVNNALTLIAGDGSSLATIPIMVAATSSTAGAAGLVPAPQAGAQDKFLRGDGTWVDLFSEYDAMVFKGIVIQDSDLPTSGYSAGWTYRAAADGIYKGEYCEVGDLIIAVNDYDSSTASNADWTKIEHNIDGALFMGHAGSALSDGTKLLNVTGGGVVTTSSSTVGSLTKPVFLNAGTLTETTHSLNATVNSGTANQVAYYSDANTIDSMAPAWQPWTAGSTNGPQANIQIGNAIYQSAAIPSATATDSGIVTTVAQTFAGDKTFQGNVLPQTSNTYDFGDTSHRWKNVYLKSGTINYMMPRDTSASVSVITIKNTSDEAIASFGFHNTGNGDNGAMYLIPYYAGLGDDSAYGGKHGLYIGTTTLKWENKYILRYSETAINGQVIISDGTTGNVKTSGYTIGASIGTGTAQYGIAYYSTTTNITSTAQGTNGALLTGKGANAPTWKASANGAVYATSANGDLQWGTLPTAQGGTGNTAFTQWGIIYANPATKLVSTSAGTAGYPLIGSGSAAPAWYGGQVNTGTAAASWITTFNGTTASTSTTTGAVKIAGGLGVAGQVTATRVGAGGSNTSYTLYVNGNSQFKIGTSDNTSHKKIVVYGNNRYLSIGSAGLQAYTSATNGTIADADTASLLYLQYNGGNIQIGQSSTVTSNVNIYGDIIPQVDLTFNLGSTANYWNNAYIKNIIYSSGEANRLVWTNSDKLLKATNHYADATSIAINSTTIPTPPTGYPTYNLYINGDARSSGDLYFEGTNNKLAAFKLTTVGTVSRANIDMGWDWEKLDGAGAAFRSTDPNLAANQIGRFVLFARTTADDTTQLVGAPTGELSWKKVSGAARMGINADANANYNLYVNGSQKIDSGSLQVYPTGGSYNDGIRIHTRSSDNNWAGLMLCGTDNTGDTGTSANSWFIANNAGTLYVSLNGSSSATVRLTGHNATGFSARPRFAVNADVNTSYNLYVNGTTYLGGNATLEGSSTLSRAGKSINWNQANTYAMLRMTSQAGWSPMLALKANTGWWTMGHYNASGCNDHLLFGFLADVDVSGVTNAKNHLDYTVRLIPTVYATNTTTVTDRAFVTSGYASSSAAKGSATVPVYVDASGVVQTITSYSGNAATATKLATARSINGTNFDGSANITTANWGTARTITIGATGKSVNGSANVSWSIGEIVGSTAIGGTAKPIYWTGSAFSAISATVGSATKPVYLNAGTITVCSYELKSTVNAGTATRIAYYSGANAISSGSIVTDGSYLRNVGGYNNASYALSTSTFICNSWVRTVGSTGWYSETYGGGWYMSDKTWIRNYGSKQIYLNALLRVDAKIQYGSSGTYYTDASGNAVFNTAKGAVWNDYAEYRETQEEVEPGRCIKEIGDDTLKLTTKRLERGCEIVSDTYGFAIGETDKSKTPIAASGRVLAYPYESREEFASHIGWPVCSGPDGTVSIMTEEEEEKYPSRIIGTISAVPDYEEWGTGNVKVNGRVWIRIR